VAITRYKTASEIVLDAGRDLGLGSVADPFASTDTKWRSLIGFLKNAGQWLAEKYEWRQLLVEAVLAKAGGVWTLPTGWSVASGDVLNLPADFAGMVEQTGWDRTNQWPLAGPISVQRWQYHMATVLTDVFAEFRIDTNQVRFLPTPLADRTLALEYKSRAWVWPAATPFAAPGNTMGPDGQDEPLVAGDIILFNRLLVVCMLKLAYKKDRGYDTTAALADVREALDIALGQQTHGPVIHLDGPVADIRLIDNSNVPDGNWSL
jgi:hypothetical protein